MSRVYTLAEAAEQLRVSERWLRGRCKEGAPHIWMAEKYLFTDRHLDQILEQFEAKPSAVAPKPPRRRKAAEDPSGTVTELKAKTPYRLRNQA